MLSDLIQIAGLTCLVIAGALVAPFIAFVVAGASLLVLGHVYDGVIKLPRLRFPKRKKSE